MDNDAQRSEARQGGKRPGFIWSVAAIVCALVAFVIPFMGLAGVALGIVGYWKGGGALSAIAIGVSVFGLVFGVIFMNLY